MHLCTLSQIERLNLPVYKSLDLWDIWRQHLILVKGKITLVYIEENLKIVVY